MRERSLILIVDDEPQIQRFLGHALVAAGYDTCTAGNGAEALAQIAAREPDLMILDLGLPDMNGKEVIESREIVPGTSSFVCDLTGTGTQTYDIYIDGEFYQSKEVPFN